VFEIRALCLQSRHSYHLSHTSTPFFVLVILEMGVSQTIFLDWPQTATLPISASQVARITGVSHLSWAKER
jgi:hypothetical protein